MQLVSGWPGLVLNTAGKFSPCSGRQLHLLQLVLSFSLGDFLPRFSSLNTILVLAGVAATYTCFFCIL